MECQPSMRNLTKEDCIILEKIICGLVQTAKQFNRKDLQILKKEDFIRGNVDLCLYIKTSGGKGKRSILTSVQTFGEICIPTYHDNSHPAKLAN